MNDLPVQFPGVFGAEFLKLVRKKQCNNNDDVEEETDDAKTVQDNCLDCKQVDTEEQADDEDGTEKVGESF